MKINVKELMPEQQQPTPSHVFTVRELRNAFLVACCGGLGMYIVLTGLFAAIKMWFGL